MTLKESTILVSPAWINAQRELGWPEIHPEDFCHRCGVKNPCWYAPKELWREATRKWAEETGREGICCPTCLLEMYEELMGRRYIMNITMEPIGD